MRSKGFTLIELLVVIVIIGLLATMVIVNVSQARVQARDTRRKADLRTMRTALESFNTRNAKYPVTGPSCWIFSAGLNAEWVVVAGVGHNEACDPDYQWKGATNSLANDLSPYLNQLPSDPLNNREDRVGSPWEGTYVYAYRSDDGEKYDFVALLENDNDPDRAEVQCYKWHSNPVKELYWTNGCGVAGDTYIGDRPNMIADH